MKTIFISILLLAAAVYGQSNKTPINNGLLQSDLDANHFKVKTANLVDYAGSGVTWNVVTGKFDVTGNIAGGSNQQFQYNSAGISSGIPGMTYDGTIPATITSTGVNTTSTGVLLRNSSIPTVDNDTARAAAIVLAQTVRTGGSNYLVEHKLEAKDFGLTIQGRTNGGAWSPGIYIYPNGAITEYNGDISITAAVLYGLDDVATGGDAGHPTRMGMFNHSTTSRPGFSMTSNAFVGWAIPSSSTYQSWEAQNDTLIQRPVAGVVSFQNAIQLTPVTVATLPTNGTQPVLAAVSDGAASLAWGATVTGGGSTKYLVWYNGTNWTVFGK